MRSSRARPSTPRSSRLWRARAVVLLLFGLLLGAAVLQAETVTGTLGIDPERRAGMDGAGNVMMYAPNPLEGGSSISHWDNSASPDLLMEPSASNNVQGVDLTTALFRDIGWNTSGSANIQIDFADPANEGFNDSSRGSQRRAAIQSAIDVWKGLLRSTVTIYARVNFDSLDCGADGAVLAQASPNFVFTLNNTPFPDTWYPGALAEALAGSNLSIQDDPDPTSPDLEVTFNSDIDDGCLGAGNVFYYGTTGIAPAGQISFYNVALHEIAHGLGFTSFTDAETGEFFLGTPDIFSQYLFDNSTRRHWSSMTAPQIQMSATNSPHLVWDGPNVRAEAASFLDPAPSLLLTAPTALAGSYPVGTAVFGPSLQTVTVSGDLVLVDDGTATPTLGCAPARNRAELQGRIALVDRGDCLFVEKAHTAQSAGAVGLVVINNQSGLITLGGTDPTIQIPVVMVSQSDGDAIKAALAGSTEPPPDPPPVDEREDPSVCMESAINLCLTEGRFRIEVNWRSSTGSGVGQAQELTSDTGYFWFFAPDNVEMVVKVLDACPQSERFWVFAGGLTDVEIEMKVVDTHTGIIRRYNNPADTPFQPIQDTDAFATCP